MENAQKKYTGPMRFAHRGVAQNAIENTLEAFQDTVDAGYEGIELDLRMSRDGQIVVCHDSHFARMTVGHPTKHCIRGIADMTWDELRQLEFPYALHLLPQELPPFSWNESLAYVPGQLLGNYENAYKTETRMGHLMLFSEFDAWLSKQGHKVTVEVEFCVPGMMRKVLEILDRSPNRHDYILFSGHRDIIEEIQTACRVQGKPEGIRLGANIRRLTPEIREFIAPLDLFEVGLNDKLYTADDVKYLNDRGIQVLSNLGDYPEWWEEMCRTGALGFKTNYAAAFTKWWYETH